jgi:hypothetical protein
MTTKIPGLEKSKFEPPAEPRHRLNWTMFGDTKTGKSSFPLIGEGGGPVVIFDLDRRLEYVVEQYPGKEVLLYKVKFPKVDPMSRKKDEQVMKEANAAWDEFLTQYDMALQSSLVKGGVRRISIDTATELFDLRVMAEFGRLMGINPRDRGGANAEFVDIMRRPEKYDASVVWLHHCKDEWKNTVDENGREKSYTTGNVVLDGFKGAKRTTQILAQTNFNDGARDPRKQFEITIIRCGVNSKLNGQKFTSMDWAVYDDMADREDPPIVNYGPLAYISSLAVPSTSPEDWI